MHTVARTLAAATAGLLLAPALASAAGRVTLVAEPLASAPLLYPGKPLVPVAGSVRMVALADFTEGSKRLDPTTLAYDWVVDGAHLIGDSGTGRRAVIVDSPLQYRSSTVEVAVSSPTGSETAGASTDLAAAEPILRVYERDPLMGIRFNRALEGSFALTGSEATLYAAPYGFPTALGAPLLSWYVAGVLAQTGNLITLRPAGRGAGEADVSLTAASRGSIDAPVGSHTLSVSFGSPHGGGFFGL